jgi:hypothetical protein
VRRLRDDHYECAQCGARLDIADDKVPRVTIHGASGRQNERVISVDGEEIHRCARPNGGDRRAALSSN